MTQARQFTVEEAIQLAQQHFAAARLSEAESICRQILAAQSNQFQALHLLGAIALQVHRYNEAIDLLGRSINSNPSNARAHAHLGQSLAAVGRSDEALEAYYRATALDPRIAEVWNNLGTELSQRKQHDAAIAAFRRAAALRPDLSHIAYNLGVALQSKGLTPEAIDAFERAIRLQPKDYLAWDRLGDALFSADRLDEAIAAHRQSIAIKPDYAESHNNLANASHASGQFQPAIEEYHRAIELRPDWPLPHYNLSLTLLLTGHFQEAWPHHEWRGRAGELGKMYRDFPKPQWDGSDLNGRRILLHSEQGIGDTVQFIRYVPLVAQRGGRIIVACHRELLDLLRTLPGIEQIVPAEDRAPDFDVHCPMLSLPAVFRTDLQTIPAEIPYLKSDPQIVGQWKQRLEGFTGKKRIGLCWAGRPIHANDRRRSLQLASLAALARPDVQFVSLQKGPAWKQSHHPPAGMNLIDRTDNLTDFAQTAALIENLDLVISVDTAVAHVAGAMGKPVWVLLPFVPDWRWMLDRSDSPWYPTMKLYRQPSQGDWTSVFNQVARELDVFTSQL